MTTKAPTPFQMIGRGVRRLGRKVVDTLAAPLVNEFKIQEKKDDGYRKAGGTLNKEFSAPVIKKVRKSTSNGSMR